VFQVKIFARLKNICCSWFMDFSYQLALSNKHLQYSEWFNVLECMEAELKLAKLEKQQQTVENTKSNSWSNATVTGSSHIVCKLKHARTKIQSVLEDSSSVHKDHYGCFAVSTTELSAQQRQDLQSLESSLCYLTTKADDLECRLSKVENACMAKNEHDMVLAVNKIATSSM